MWVKKRPQRGPFFASVFSENSDLELRHLKNKNIFRDIPSNSEVTMGSMYGILTYMNC